MIRINAVLRLDLSLHDFKKAVTLGRIGSVTESLAEGQVKKRVPDKLIEPLDKDEYSVIMFTE